MKKDIVTVKFHAILLVCSNVPYLKSKQKNGVTGKISVRSAEPFAKEAKTGIGKTGIGKGRRNAGYRAGLRGRIRE
ncbi:MAG: hypothetical protein D3914_07540 [Candidatus Electrothrix sp. LOE2]|nr:hypothetical protein [Candidatus Electrothrix sp. LOE2]